MMLGMLRPISKQKSSETPKEAVRRAQTDVDAHTTEGTTTSSVDNESERESEANS